MDEQLVGLIPAAGRGLRLGLPYPKELYPIIDDNRYKPVSQFIVENIRDSGAKHTVFVINQTKHQLMGFFGDGSRFGCEFSYVIQEARGDSAGSRSPGLAHALNSAYHLTKGKTVFSGMADTIINPTNAFQVMMEQAKPSDQLILGMFEVSRPEKFGMVAFDEADMRVRYIDDKPSETDLTLAWGCLVWRSDFTEHLYRSVTNGQGDFAEIMNRFILLGSDVRAVVLPKGSYSDMGTYDELMEIDRQFRRGANGP